MDKLSLLCVFLCLVSVSAYPTGPPVEACSEMKPGHYGITPESSDPPYTIELSTDCFSQSDQEITVTVKATSSDYNFKGFFVQAAHAGEDDSDENVAYGMMSLTEVGDEASAKTFTCFEDSDSVGHRNREVKPWVSFTWTPGNTMQSVKFNATIVKQYNTYWMGVQSQTLHYKDSCPPEPTDHPGHTDRPVVETTKKHDPYPTPPISMAASGIQGILTVVITFVLVAIARVF